ncbi:hypothetical protein [Microcella alkalica]|uniref:Uncharacterized protein n=1 Tax=Microcella alkalica TaxID=355930 RepID=A0A839E687_9MICO|nr:hypothetical protein [Microcella alkalica]MBA8847921.1 hypothetical protein [Microcella alkalica]
MDDDPRELREADWPDDGDGTDGRSPAWERRARVMRIISIVALLSLVVPGALATWALAQSTAATACRLAVDALADVRTPTRVAFELTSLETAGWNCYALAPTGEVRVAVLGVIPGAPDLRPRSGS